MFSKILVLECLTNMHAGNGDVNYNIIDNEVEKDPVSGYPTINASGVKGALREYFSVNGTDGKKIDAWFGSNSEKSQGKVKLLAADFVAMPVRATAGSQASYTVTTDDTVCRINELSEVFAGKSLFKNERKNDSSAVAEGIRILRQIDFCSKPVYLVTDTELRRVSLPVIARNKLDNGISKNLWYEEVVPHGSIFIVPVVSDDETALNDFVTSLKGKVVQFGGNASIGYGLCKIGVEG